MDPNQVRGDEKEVHMRYLEPNGVVKGRPPLRGRAKRQVTLRLDPDVIEKFRESGPGWQGRMNDALRKAAGLEGQ